jgi:hypothetical protein
LTNLGVPRTCIKRSLAVKWIISQHCNLVDDAVKDIAELQNLENGFYHVMESARRNYHEHIRLWTK